MKPRHSFIAGTNRCLFGLGLCALVACVLAVAASAQREVKSASNLTEPHTMSEDFQGAGLGQWASYPPAQDIGYEPSLSPTRDFGAPGGRALMRVVRPNRAGVLRFGFIKRVRVVISVDAQLRFSYRLNSPAPGATLEIGLASADGRRYTKRIPAHLNGWDTTNLKLAEFRSVDGRFPVTGDELEAIYLVADLTRTDPDVTYRFLLDDVTLAARREAGFEVRTPHTEAIEPWTSLVSARGFRAGDAIAIEARAPARLVRAECAIETQDGRAIVLQPLYDDGTHGDKQTGDGVWSNNSIHSINAASPAGIWIARLKGKTAAGHNVTTRVRFINHPSGTRSSHPRLFFAAADREKLVARAREPKLAPVWTALQTTAKNTRETGELTHGGEVFEMLDAEYLLPSLLAYFDILNRARSRIAHNALEAYITDSAVARAAAKSALLDVVRWKKWVPPWFEAHGQHTYYPAGQLAADVAFGYDLLYDHLTEEERSLVRRALVEKSIIPTYREYVADNRVMANTSNWIAHTVGGALIAASAIAGEVSESESGGRFEIYLNGLLLKLEDHMAASFLADGSYGEGISYHEFDTETLAPALAAIRRATGIDYWNGTHVLDSLTYPLYTLARPTSASLDMGDTHPPAGHGIPALVYQSKDPVVRWYYEQFDRPSISKFIFYDDSVAPQPPRLPTSRLFPQKGNAVFRTGWAADDLVFLLRAGPNFNHHHADQGSFLLTAFGEPLITEAGWSDYYKDPYYATFFTQAIGHNTVLVDGNPESQDIADTPQFAALNRYPRITDAVTSEFYDAVGSELSSVYGGRLQRFTRRVAFVKPHYFVIFDDLVANGPPARFDWLLHLPDRKRIKTAPRLALYGGEKAALAVQAFAPVDAELHVRDGRVPYHEFAMRTPKTVPPQPAFLDVQTTKPANEMQFLVALVPARTSGEAQAFAGRMTGITSDGWSGLRTERGEERDVVMFRVGATKGATRYEEWMTDAVAWTITQRGEALRMLALQNARSFTRGGRALFASDNAASVAASYNANAVEVAYQAASQAKVQLFVGTKPVRVLLDGREVSARYDRGGATISLIVPAGQHQLNIALQ